MEKLKKLFFDESLKRWHFDDLIKKSDLSRERVSSFLKMLLKEKIIVRVKPLGKMPYYLANKETPKFREQKRLWGLKELTELFEHINSLPEIQTAIIFGSFSRGDWSKSSDIDIFIYGDAKNFDKRNFEKKLKREIQLFNFTETKAIKKELDPSLIPNIVKGFNIKGSLEPFEVEIRA